jgi:hypothetical protein
MIPVKYLEYLDSLVDSNDLRKLEEVMGDLVEQHGIDIYDFIKDRYGEDLFNFLDLDDDGSIIDTIPDLILGIVNWFSDI